MSQVPDDKNKDKEELDEDVEMPDVDENDSFDDDDGDDWDKGDKEEGGWSGDDLVDPQEEIVIKTKSEPDLLRQFSVKALEPEAIDQAMDKRIAIVKENLDLDDFDCLLLLRTYKWNAQKVMEEYFKNPEKVKESSGCCINPKKPSKNKGKIECQICYDDYDVKQFFSLQCGHQTTCMNCWLDYLRDAVVDKSCVHLVCPAFKCNVVIPRTVWRQLLAPKSPDAFRRYKRFCRENFVENSKDFGFCPGKNCDMIYLASVVGVAKEVICHNEKCKYRFCWACKHESHYPCNCFLAQKWIIKCSSEAENLSWIIAKTKKCPKCGVHIEKNQGCNHMTCRKHAGGCGYEFCWLCKGDWKEHGTATGGYYQCNIFEKNKQEGKMSDEEKAQQDAENELERYEFHWTRFDSHQKSSNHVRKEKTDIDDKMDSLAKKFKWRLNEAQFLMDAVNEAITCWHVLAWTYPIAFYFDKDHQNVLNLFKTQQGTLEKFCDGLQQKLDFNQEQLGDIKIRQEIKDYTKTAQKYRKNLVEYIETEIVF